MTQRRVVVSHRVVLALAGIVVVACGTARATDTPQSTFFHGNSLYAEGKYGEAASEYEKVVAGGSESVALYFNLGNAYFKAGKKGEAILNYERALRLAPTDPDVEANLGFARELTGAEVCDASLWERAAFPLATATTTAGLWRTTIGWYSLALLLLSAARFIPGRPRWLVWVAGIVGVVGVVSATSLLGRLWREERYPTAVVVGAGEVAARFEPATTGTKHFVLKEGTRVAITDRREGWIQAQRCDGRRGWIEASSAVGL